MAAPSGLNMKGGFSHGLPLRGYTVGYKQIHTFGAQFSIKLWDSLTLPDFEHRR
jgi:hypothetical protein